MIVGNFNFLIAVKLICWKYFQQFILYTQTNEYPRTTHSSLTAHRSPLTAHRSPIAGVACFRISLNFDEFLSWKLIWWFLGRRWPDNYCCNKRARTSALHSDRYAFRRYVRCRRCSQLPSFHILVLLASITFLITFTCS